MFEYYRLDFKKEEFFEIVDLFYRIVKNGYGVDIKSERYYNINGFINEMKNNFDKRKAEEFLKEMSDFVNETIYHNMDGTFSGIGGYYDINGNFKNDGFNILCVEFSNGDFDELIEEVKMWKRLLSD